MKRWSSSVNSRTGSITSSTEDLVGRAGWSGGAARPVFAALSGSGRPARCETGMSQTEIAEIPGVGRTTPSAGGPAA